MRTKQLAAIAWTSGCCDYVEPLEFLTSLQLFNAVEKVEAEGFAFGGLSGEKYDIYAFAQLYLSY
jgi:hypothetical protein